MSNPSSINKANTRSFPGADVGSDHDLLMTTVKLKLKSKRNPKNPRIRFDLDKLKDKEVADVFNAQVGGKFAALNLLQDVDTLTNEVKEIYQSAGDEILGQKRVKRNP